MPHLLNANASNATERNRPFCTGVCWYPEQWPEKWWRRDAERMRETGIEVVRLGEFAWSRLQPSRHEWRMEWLRRALDILHSRGLRAIVGTPTAAAPRWLVDEFPDLLRVGEDGRAAAFGSRRFACLAHPGYARACVVVARKMAQEFGAHPAVCAWQIDNEYGWHDTAFSWSAAAAKWFRRWLRRRYGAIAALNDAWGNAFWSMEYGDFSQIEPPLPIAGGHNPALVLDFRRFWTERIGVFNRRQARAVRRHSPGRDVLHDFMGFFTDFDHFAVAADVDIAAWNSYPLGFLARFGGTSERLQYMRTGHPDYAAFHHDLYRACGRGRFCITEQQPGPVNWAAYNPVPAPGAVRFWTLEAFAHGAEMVSYFRWRQNPHAQEQMHAGLFTPNDRPAPAAAEAAQVAHEIARLPAHAFAPPQPAAVALVFDYQSAWITDIAPHGDSPPLPAVMAFYSALRRAGVEADIVPPHADFCARKLVIAPLLCAPPEDFSARLRAAGCAALFGPRCGAKTAHFAVPSDLPPGNLRDLLGLTVLRVDSLPPEMSMPVRWREEQPAEKHAAVRWREIVRPHGAQTLATFAEDGHGAVFVSGKYYYLACRPNAALLDAVVAAALRCAGVDAAPPPADVRVKQRGGLTWFFNYGAQPASPHITGEVVINTSGASSDNRADDMTGAIPPGGVLALRPDCRAEKPRA